MCIGQKVKYPLLICSQHPVLHHREVEETTPLTTPWPERSEGGGVRRRGALCDYSSSNWSGRWSEVEGAAEAKNKVGAGYMSFWPQPQIPSGEIQHRPKCVHRDPEVYCMCKHTDILHCIHRFYYWAACVRDKTQSEGTRGKRTDPERVDYWRPVHGKSQ